MVTMKGKIIRPSNLLERIKNIPQKYRKKWDEQGVVGKFINLFNKKTNTNYICFGSPEQESPDFICKDKMTDKEMELEVSEITIPELKANIDYEGKIRTEISKQLNKSYEETNLSYGFRVDVHFLDAPPKKQMKQVFELVNDEFHKFLIGNKSKVEIRRPHPLVELLRIQIHDSRRQVIVLISGFPVLAYFGEDDVIKLQKLIEECLKSKADEQVYDKYLLLYFSVNSWQVEFSKETLLQAVKNINLTNFKNIQEAYLVFEADHTLHYYDFKKHELIS